MLTLATFCGDSWQSHLVAEKDLNIINEVMTGCVCSKFLFFLFQKERRKINNIPARSSTSVWSRVHVAACAVHSAPYGSIYDVRPPPNEQSESGTCGNQQLRRSFHVWLMRRLSADPLWVWKQMNFFCEDVIWRNVIFSHQSIRWYIRWELHMWMNLPPPPWTCRICFIPR